MFKKMYIDVDIIRASVIIAKDRKISFPHDTSWLVPWTKKHCTYDWA